MAYVKICGINSPHAFSAASAADWIGFNFYPPSPRYVSPTLVASMTGGPTRVGLFVQPTDKAIAATLAIARLDVLQVYCSPGRAAAIRRQFGLPVWLSVGVGDSSDLPTDGRAVDGFVIESKSPPGAILPGGNATPFDWAMLNDWKPPCPWLLAGGLDPRNVAAAIAASGARAVDVSSGVERQRGVKDDQLISAFIEAARPS